MSRKESRTFEGLPKSNIYGQRRVGSGEPVAIDELPNFGGSLVEQLLRREAINKRVGTPDSKK